MDRILLLTCNPPSRNFSAPARTILTMFEPPTMDTRNNWRASSALYLHSWGDEFVVYHSRSGDTHLLGLAAAHILLALQRAPSNSIILSKSLAPLLGVQTDDEFILQIDEILADLDTLALIERS